MIFIRDLMIAARSKRQRNGFTLLELILVIVILGALAAVALPKFMDLSNDADWQTVRGVAKSITSASAINLAAKHAGNPSAIPLNFDGVCSDQTLSPLLNGGIPAAYEIEQYSFPSGNCSGSNEGVWCVVRSKRPPYIADAAYVACAR